MGVKEYVSLPIYVKALQYTGENLQEVLEFCNGRLQNPEDDKTTKVITYDNYYIMTIQPTYWVVEFPDGDMFVDSDEEFNATYREKSISV